MRSLDLSQGAFKALTGGKMDPPGQFIIEWYTIEQWRLR